MHSIFALLACALMSITALAAPTPTKKLAKRSFKIPSVPRIAVARSPIDEMSRTYLRMGWEIVLLEPPSPFDSDVSSSSTSAAPVVAATSSTTTLTAVATSSSVAPATTSTVPVDDGNENGEVDAAPEANEAEYLSPVTIGGQSLHLDFDTGSADL